MLCCASGVIHEIVAVFYLLKAIFFEFEMLVEGGNLSCGGLGLGVKRHK